MSLGLWAFGRFSPFFGHREVHSGLSLTALMLLILIVRCSVCPFIADHFVEDVFDLLGAGLAGQPHFKNDDVVAAKQSGVVQVRRVELRDAPMLQYLLVARTGARPHSDIEGSVHRRNRNFSP